MQRFIVNSLGRNADLVNRLHAVLSRLWPATAMNAASVADAVAGIVARDPRPGGIHSIEFWGHGRPGAMAVGDEELTPESFDPDHPHARELSRLLPCLHDEACISFVGCQTFAGTDGKRLAQAAVAFFKQRISVAGHTRLIGYNLDWGGVVCLRPGEKPAWPDADPRDKAPRKQTLRALWRRLQEGPCRLNMM
jgi:hypothetical protein